MTAATTAFRMNDADLRQRQPIVNVAPCPSSLVTLIEPLCASTIALAM